MKGYFVVPLWSLSPWNSPISSCKSSFRPMKSLYSCSALSLAYPYFCCKSPRSFSLFPSTWVRSSSVSLPHFSLTPPLISFHFPFRTSSFMFALLSSCSRKQGCPANVHLPLCQGPAQRSTPWSLHGPSTLKDIDQHHHDRDDQENVNESAHRVRGDQTQRPEDKQNDRYGPEHFSSPPSVVQRQAFAKKWHP